MNLPQLEFNEFKLHRFISFNTSRTLPKDLVVKYACEATEITREQFFSRRKDREVCIARQIAMAYVCANPYHLKQSLKEVGEMFGDKHHATVIHARRIVTELNGRDKEMTEYIKKFRHKIIVQSYEYSTDMKAIPRSHKKKVKQEVELENAQ